MMGRNFFKEEIFVFQSISLSWISWKEDFDLKFLESVCELFHLPGLQKRVHVECADVVFAFGLEGV